MACFAVSAAEALVTTIITKVVEKKEKKRADKYGDASGQNASARKTPFSRKLKWLNNMLWGGSALLMFEHIWHGEVVPYFPFLTAASNPEDAAVMLREMATVGVAMAALVTLVWVGVVAVSSIIEKRAEKTETSPAANEN